MARLIGARVARFELPGRRWFIAVCEDCRWVGFSWKDKGWARDDRDLHNRTEHPIKTVVG